MFRDVSVGGNIFPGFNIPRGSNCCLIRRIKSKVTGSISRSTKSRFSRPTPCSPDKVPCKLSTSEKTASRQCDALCICRLSSGSISRLTWILPLPAWPKLIMGMAYCWDSCSRPRIRSGILDTGTTTSSLIFLGATLRSAGDRALRVAHKAAISSGVSAELICSNPLFVAALLSTATA